MAQKSLFRGGNAGIPEKNKKIPLNFFLNKCFFNRKQVQDYGRGKPSGLRARAIAAAAVRIRHPAYVQQLKSTQKYFK